MARLGYLIRRRDEECSIVKVLPGGRDECPNSGGVVGIGMTPSPTQSARFVKGSASK
jgi:hypothetical protein